MKSTILSETHRSRILQKRRRRTKRSICQACPHLEQNHVRSFPRRAVVRAANTALRRSSRGEPVPLATLLRLRAFGNAKNILTFKAAGVPRPGSALENPFLADRLGDRRLGDWTISAQAMNFLEREIRARPATRVLEFGSGLSTACLARYMLENAAETARSGVISLEESAPFASESRKTLAGLGLDDLASVHHAPLVEQDVAGRRVKCYDLPERAVAAMREVPADLVFIDGPGLAGGPYSRWAVLHLVLPLLPEGFRFFLDDALSDSALECAQLWNELPGVKVQGVALVGHGILVGEYRP